MIINHFGLSSGKDSTALVGWAFHESGYPIESLRFSFADTQNEYDEVYQQIARLNDYVTSRGSSPVRTLHSEGFLNLCIRKKRFPGAKSRFCTIELKIIPSLHYFEELWLDGHDIVSHSGVRADESTERSVMSEFQDHPNGYKIRRPLLSRSISDVWHMYRKYKLPINPLYAQGWKRVGCRLCCMSNKADVRRTALKRPWVIDLYEQWESIVGAVSSSSYATFFKATAPEHLRSIKGLIRKNSNRSKTKMKGSAFSLSTIRDIVKWSMTLHGGKQSGFNFMFEEDDSHSPCSAGYCE